MYVDIQDLSEKLSVSVSTVRGWVKSGVISPSSYFKVANVYRYNFEEVLSCLHDHNGSDSEALNAASEHHDPQKDEFGNVIEVTNQPSSLTAEISINKGVVEKKHNILDNLKLHQALRLAAKKSEKGAASEAQKIYIDILSRFPKNRKAFLGIKALRDLSVDKEIQESFDYDLHLRSVQEHIENSFHNTPDNFEILLADYKFLVSKLFVKNKFLMVKLSTVKSSLNDASLKGIDIGNLDGVLDDLRAIQEKLIENGYDWGLNKIIKDFVHLLYKKDNINIENLQYFNEQLWKIAGELETVFEVVEDKNILDILFDIFDNSPVESYQSKCDKLQASIEKIQSEIFEFEKNDFDEFYNINNETDEIRVIHQAIADFDYPKLIGKESITKLRKSVFK